MCLLVLTPIQLINWYWPEKRKTHIVRYSQFFIVMCYRNLERILQYWICIPFFASILFLCYSNIPHSHNIYEVGTSRVGVDWFNKKTQTPREKKYSITGVIGSNISSHPAETMNTLQTFPKAHIGMRVMIERLFGVIKQMVNSPLPWTPDNMLWTYQLSTHSHLNISPNRLIIHMPICEISTPCLLPSPSLPII